jgi:hypothetical protein
VVIEKNNLPIKNIASIYILVSLFILLFCFTFTLYFIVSNIFYIFIRKKIYKEITLINIDSKIPTLKPKITILHMTCNNFKIDIMLKIMEQDYSNVEYCICDDSSKEEYIKMINEFAKKYNCLISRRPSEHKKMHNYRYGN